MCRLRYRFICSRCFNWALARQSQSRARLSKVQIQAVSVSGVGQCDSKIDLWWVAVGALVRWKAFVWHGNLAALRRSSVSCDSGIGEPKWPLRLANSCHLKCNRTRGVKAFREHHARFDLNVWPRHVLLMREQIGVKRQNGWKPWLARVSGVSKHFKQHEIPINWPNPTKFATQKWLSASHMTWVALQVTWNWS